MTVANPTRYTTLDLVRGVAIFAVVTVHAFQLTLAFSPDNGIGESSRAFVGMSYFRFGVELFYILSGWLIFSIYRSSRNETGLQYLAKRAGRIWPLWIAFSALSFVGLLVGWGMSPVAGRFAADSTVQWILGFLLVVFFLGWLSPSLWNVPAGGWSIQVEIGHYALFWFLRKRGELTLLVTVLVGYASYFAARGLLDLTDSGTVTHLAESWIRLGLYGTWPFFVAGGLAFIWSRKSQAPGLDTSTRARVITRWALILVIVIVATRVPIPYGMTYEAVAACVVLLGVSWLVIKTVLAVRVGAGLGKYSYFIYFAHFWVLEFVAPRTFSFVENLSLAPAISVWLQFVLGLVVTLAICMGLGILSWRFFEVYWIRLSRRVK